MKNLTLIFIILLAVIAFSSCQESTKTNSKANETNVSSGENKSADNTSKPAAGPEEEEKPTSNLKPEDIDLEKPFPAEELNAAFLADQDAWKGKEVSVIGKYHSTTTSTVMDEDRIRVDISDAKTNKKQAGCIVKKDPAKEIGDKREDRVFKGKIVEERYGRILIEPCEFVK